MSKTRKPAAAQTEAITIKAPNFQRIEFRVRGTAPLLQAAFSNKTRARMRATMEAGSTAKSKRKKDPRDFEADFLDAMHVSTDGWPGVPAAAFRAACIDVCRMVGFKMTHAKMSIFVEADGLDADSGQPLVMLDAGEPEMSVLATRNATGVADLRARPMWREWSLRLRVRYDADQFTASDVANLVERAGTQIGIGEGRPFSKSSYGMGFGTFTCKEAP